MNRLDDSTFNDLVAQCLGRRLPENLADQIPWPALAPDARGVIRRLLALMKRSSCPATEFNTQMIWLLASVTPAMLPAAWGGRIPPLTSRGRHRKLDAYVRQLSWPGATGRPVFIDLGCGFPPATTVDTAGTLPDWSVYGVDPSFFRFVLYDVEGRYAVFNRDGEFQYCQSPLKPLDETPEAVRKHFQSLFLGLRPRLTAPQDDHASANVAKDGHKLICNHIRDYETENLTFIRAAIEDFKLPPARFIRCMNVLLYFPRAKRHAMLSSIAESLEDGGLLMTGFNHPFGIYARYAVFRKTAAGVQPSEFAFGLDNLRPLGIGPWLTLAEEDQEAELLADLTAAIRRDPIFWTPFSAYVDGLREELGIGRRANNGFWQFTEEIRSAPPHILSQKTATLWNRVEASGFADGAVEALVRAGLTAWKNQVGDIAVLPPENSLPAV